MRVLVACERSQKVCLAFRALGDEAYSCDLLPSYGGYPEFHLEMDALDAIRFNIWDLIIAHPPCTYLTRAGNQCHSLSVYSDDNIVCRSYSRLAAMRFFLDVYSSDCPHVVVENPVGVPNTFFRKPDQIIHPYFFCSPGSPDYVSKMTCLWLKGVPPLVYDPPGSFPDLGVFPNGKRRNWTELKSDPTIRSETFSCIAAAMASQWHGIF